MYKELKQAERPIKITYYPYVNIIVDDFMTAIIDDVVLLEVTSVDLINKQVIKGKIKKIILDFSKKVVSVIILDTIFYQIWSCTK